MQGTVVGPSGEWLADDSVLLWLPLVRWLRWLVAAVSRLTLLVRWLVAAVARWRLFVRWVVAAVVASDGGARALAARLELELLPGALGLLVEVAVCAAPHGVAAGGSGGGSRTPLPLPRSHYKQGTAARTPRRATRTPATSPANGVCPPAWTPSNALLDSGGCQSGYPSWRPFG